MSEKSFLLACVICVVFGFLELEHKDMLGGFASAGCAAMENCCFHSSIHNLPASIRSCGLSHHTSLSWNKIQLASSIERAAPAMQRHKVSPPGNSWEERVATTLQDLVTNIHNQAPATPLACPKGTLMNKLDTVTELLSNIPLHMCLHQSDHWAFSPHLSEPEQHSTGIIN